MFDYSWLAEPETESELVKYDQRGDLISSDPGYVGSPIETLENFVLTRVESIRNYIGDESVVEGDDFSKLFFAMVAPSMTGKTQAAFTFRRIRCLYFLLSDLSEGMQKIYKNFEELSTTFRNLITDDFKKLKKLNALSREPGDIYNQISSSKLFQKHRETKFKTLGFIYSLIEDANANFNPAEQSWMSFFAKAPRSFIVRSKSLLDFESFNIGNYVLFFDEFESSDENAFVRNLFRTAFTPLFVANTNSDAANFVGSLSSGSREDDLNAWSLAAIKLNSINRNILTGMQPGLIKKINTIIRTARTDYERNLIELFLDNFFNEQLNHIRPGFADVIATTILNLPLANQVTLNSILEAVVGALCSKLIEKKPAIEMERVGILGSFALFLNNAYLKSNITSEEFAAKFSHMKSYLQHHFYYLINPVDVNKWCFLTYRPAGIRDRKNYLRLRDLTWKHGFKEWQVEYTYFMEEEIIPFFACQGITTPISIPYAFSEGLEFSDANPLTTGRATNTTQNVPLNGGELEVLSSTCIIDASQYCDGSSASTFTGQDGKTFLTNLIGNLIKDNGYRRSSKVELNCNVIQEAYLDRVVVPFMFPAGMKLPEFFKNNFYKPEGFVTRSVNFGEFERTENSTQIDQKFRYFLKNGPRTDPSIGICSVECKYWRVNLFAGDLVPILEKAKRNLANICLLFCNSLGNSTVGTLNSFTTFCNDKRILLFRIAKVQEQVVGKKKFELVPYCPGLTTTTTDVLMTCIIYELNVINS